MVKIDGVVVPDSTMATEAIELVRDTASPLLFNHSNRVYYFATLAGQQRGLEFDSELLYVGSRAGGNESSDSTGIEHGTFLAGDSIFAGARAADDLALYGSRCREVPVAGDLCVRAAGGKVRMTTLSPQKRGTRTVRKITRNRIDAALKVLSKKTPSPEAVHEARKALKKARAGLRMLRPGVKEAVYRNVNEALRDAARPLSATRDAQVLGDTLAALVRRYGAPASHLQLGALRRAIARRRADTQRQLRRKVGEIAHSRGLLREARARVEVLAVDAHDWKVLGLGVERIYRGCRRAMADAVENSACAPAFHEWRKQVKYLRYELAMLEPPWPALIDALTDQAHRLTDYLGEDHDLTVLREIAAAQRGELPDRSLKALLALIERRQDKLRKKATRLGARLFEEKPKRFRARLDDYWRKWRPEPPAE